eukprot:scaffold442_cov397-Prasinococcus_capsulatus_cf.AAC.40
MYLLLQRFEGRIKSPSGGSVPFASILVDRAPPESSVLADVDRGSSMWLSSPLAGVASTSRRTVSPGYAARADKRSWRSLSKSAWKDSEPVCPASLSNRCVTGMPPANTKRHDRATLRAQGQGLCPKLTLGPLVRSGPDRDWRGCVCTSRRPAAHCRAGAGQSPDGDHRCRAC